MLHRLEFRAMGCEMLAVVECDSAPAMLSRVPEWFEAWEQILSRFRYDSELTHLNQSHNQPVPVSQPLWDVFQAARQAAELTDGLVTPTVLDAIRQAGYDRPFDNLTRLSTSSPDSEPSVSAPLKAITAHAPTRSITLPEGTGLDFGGVAKGWAAHQAMQWLQVAGPALIDAGGDIAISGPLANGRPWQVGIADPFQAGHEIKALFLKAGCGVATSGKDRRRWLRNGDLQHHIIDPATNQPAETDLLTVTVIAATVMEAEAAAKAIFILGAQAGLEWLEAHPAYAGVLILDNQQLLYSRNMNQYW